MKLAPFYLNQEIGALTDTEHFKKGDEFKVEAIYRSKCCGVWMVEIGIYSDSPWWMKCGNCKRKITGSIKKQLRFRAVRFAPKLKLGEFVSMTKVVDEAIALVSMS